MLREQFWDLTAAEKQSIASFLRSENITIPSSTFDQASVDTVINEATGSFDQSIAIGQNTSDSLTAYALYQSRNQSLTNIANDLTTENNKQKQLVSKDLQTSTRQTEINNWEYENKMDTLFFLQVLFITLCISAVALYLRHSFLLSGTVAFSMIGLGILVAVLVLLNRWMFTSRLRDKRYWNRQYIPASKSLSSDINKCV